MSENPPDVPAPFSATVPVSEPLRADPVQEAMQTLHSEMDLISVTPVVAFDERPLELQIASDRAMFDTADQLESLKPVSPDVDNSWFHQQRDLNLAMKTAPPPVPERSFNAVRPYFEPLKKVRLSGRSRKLPTLRRRRTSSVDGHCEACGWKLEDDRCPNLECPTKPCSSCSEHPCSCGE